MMALILEIMLWAIIILGGSLAFGLVTGKFIGFGSGEEEHRPPTLMPRKD